MRTVLAIVADDARHLAEVIDSVLRQTDRDFTLVVAGTPPDGLPDDPRVSPAPRRGEGLAAARAAASDAEFLAWLDGRVVLHPEWLQATRAALDAAPEAAGAYSQTVLYSDGGADLGSPARDEPSHALFRSARVAWDERMTIPDGVVKVPRLLCHRRVPTTAPPRPTFTDKLVHRVRRALR